MKRWWMPAAFVLLFCGCEALALPYSYGFSKPGTGKEATRAASDEQTIRALLKEWIDALVRNDSAARARLMADDFILTTYVGQVIDKSQILEAAKSSAYRIEAVNPEEVKVRVYGNAAVLSARVALTERINDQSVTNQVQVTQTWIKRRGRWQVVAEQATRIVEQ